MTVSERTLSYRGSDVAAAYETVGYRSAHEPKLLRQRFSEIGNDIYDLLRLSYSTTTEPRGRRTTPTRSAISPRPAPYGPATERWWPIRAAGCWWRSTAPR